MSLIADGGGTVRVTTSVPTVTPASPAPAPSTASDAAARARQLQSELEAMLERLREAQRRAEAARQRAIEAQQKAEQARQAAEAAKAQADKTKAAADQVAAAKAQQDCKLQDARLRKASADADLQDKDVALLRAQVAQKREQVKAPDGKASAAADGKVQGAQADRDAASRTADLSTLYANAQESESKAQDAEAKVARLAPTPGRPSETIGADERKALSDAQADATRLRGQANADEAKFENAVGAQAGTQFYGDLPATAATAPPLLATPAADIATDPLHSPLLQLLQMSPGTPGAGPVAPFATGTTPLFTPSSPSSLSPSTTFSPFLVPPKTPAPQLVQTLTGIADGKSLAQIASAEHLGTDQVLAQAKAAGVDIQPATAGADVQVTTLHKGDVTLTYTHDLKHDTVTVKGTVADPAAPGGHRTIEATRDGQGVFSQTVKDPKTGNDVTHRIDPKAGTQTDIVVAPDGTRTETTTALTGAPVLRPVKDGEGYLDVAKAADLTPEQLLALNPDVDYGVALKTGQELVVSGVPTTVKTFNPDGTTLERTTDADGTLRVVATSASGRRTVLMGDADAQDPTTTAVRKALFDDRKTIAQTAASLGLTQDQVLAALPPGTVDVTPAGADTAGLTTRTIFDPQTNRTVVETDDPRHDRTVLTEIGADQVFKVRQFDAKTGKYVMADVAGGVGYAQQQADQKLATVGDYARQIADLDSTIRLYHHTGDSVTDLLAQRGQLVAQQKAAQGAADIAQGKATSLQTKQQQVQVDQLASNAYQNWFVARPGSKDQADAKVALDQWLALSDKTDRLVASADKDVALLKAGVDKQQAHDAADAADTNLQAQFEKWKDDVWMWQDIPKKTADEMKAKGETPAMRTFSDPQQEHDVAWEAFVDLQKDLDKYGDDGLPPEELAARDAWVHRNQASDAALKADTRYDDAATASTEADGNVLQGDLARLQQKKAAWVQAHPDDLPLNFRMQDGDGATIQQSDIDQLGASVAKGRIDVLGLGEDRKHTQYLLTVSAADRADPDALKKAEDKYAQDNQDATTKLNRQIDELQTADARGKADAIQDYIAKWKVRNPELQKQLDALGSPNSQGSVRAAEYRQDQTNKLLSASEQGRQLKDALAMQDTLQGQFMTLADQDVTRVQKDDDGIQKDIDGHTWVRDAWGSMFGDSSDDAKDYTDAQLDKARQLRNDLASGKLSVSDYARQEDGFLDSYDVKSADLTRKMEDSDGTWSVVDEAVRTTVSAAAGIAATIASGGNVAVGFAVGMGVNELWDTAGDVVAAAQGRDVNADGHTSLLTLEAKVVTGHASWDDVKFTLKDEAIDFASNAVTLTGVGAGARVTESLTAQLALKDTLSIGGRSLLKVGLKEGSTDTLTWGGRAIAGAGAGVTAQGVDGLGRVGVETLHVGLDGQLGTDEGDQRIRSTIVSSAAGLITAPLTGAFSGAIPIDTGLGIGGQILNDTAGSLGTGELISFANDGRAMDRAEFIASSLQIGPSVLQHVAVHPMAARAQARAAGARGDGTSGAPSSVDGDGDETPLFKVDGDDAAVDAPEQLALFGDGPFKPAPAARPRLETYDGQRIADLVHLAGPTATRSMNGKTVGLTELADGRVAVTLSGKEAGLNPNQRRVAQMLLQDSGFAAADIIMMEGPDGNPHYQAPKDRHLDPETRDVSWHAEQKGIQAGKLFGSDAVRQWSSSGKNPRGTEEGGHGGAACTHCLDAQRDYRVVNETGLQPPKGEPSPYLLSDGRRWGGRDDRVDRVIPGVDWESLRVRPSFLDPQPEATTLEATARGGSAPPGGSGWDTRLLERVALHPDVQEALLDVLAQEHPGRSPADDAQELQMAYGDQAKVRGMARDNPDIFRRQVLAAWHALEQAGTPVDLDGFTPLVSPRPAVFQIRPAAPPRLADAGDFADAIDRVTARASDIAAALRSDDPASRIELKLLSRDEFAAEMRALGKNPNRVVAVARGRVVTLNGDSNAWEQLLSMVHEGTHALDYLEQGDAARSRTISIGDLEARAYANENEFAQAMGLHGQARGEAFPALVRPQMLHPLMRDVHLHIDDAYPQATRRWIPPRGAGSPPSALFEHAGASGAGRGSLDPAGDPRVTAIEAELVRAGLDPSAGPGGLLYRIDTQSPQTLRGAGGMQPRPGVGAIRNPTLQSYVEANTPGRWLGTSKSVAHIVGFLADNPQRVKAGETGYLYVVKPHAATRADVLQHYQQSGRFDALSSTLKDVVTREGEIAVDGGVPWTRVVGWAEIDPSTGRLTQPFQRNPDYVSPASGRPRVILRTPDEGLEAQPLATSIATPPTAGPTVPTATEGTLAASTGADPAASPGAAQAFVVPDLSTGWKQVLPLPNAPGRSLYRGPEPETSPPALIVVNRPGPGPKAVFDAQSGRWVERGASPDPSAPDPAGSSGVPPAAAPDAAHAALPPATTRRVAVATTLGAGSVGLATLGAFEFVPAHLFGTALTWAIAGSAMRGGIKLARFAQSRKWEGRIDRMAKELDSKASFEHSLNTLEDLGQRRLDAGADPATHAAFSAAVDRLLHQDPRGRLFRGVRERRLHDQADELRANAHALGIPVDEANELVDSMQARLGSRASFDRDLALHTRFAERLHKDSERPSRMARVLTGIPAAKAEELKGNLSEVEKALVLLRNKNPVDDPQALEQLKTAVANLSVAPNLRPSTSLIRWTIDGVQLATYGVAANTLLHGYAALPGDLSTWPTVAVASVFAVSNVADGVKIAAVRWAGFRQPSDRAPISEHPFIQKGLGQVDEQFTLLGSLATVAKTGTTLGVDIAHPNSSGHLLIGNGIDVAAALPYAYGALRQLRNSMDRGFKDPAPDDSPGRKTMLNAKIIAGTTAIALAVDSAAQKIWFSDDDKKKRRGPDILPTPTPTPTATQSGTPPGPTSPVTPPGHRSPPPPPPAPPAQVIVTAGDPRRATLWGIANANEASLLTGARMSAARAAGGADAETAAALQQLFQLNPQRHFRPALMDGVASAVPGDPDTILPGWVIDVDNPAVS